jgi:GT2 family glycosyltransferase
MNEQVTVVTVSHNCADALWECLRKLTGGAGVPPIIVVDNASKDKSAEVVARDFPSAQLIQNQTNRGFAAAANQGIRASNSDFILLLAPDMLLNTPDLLKLYEAIRLRPGVGICAPSSLNPNGSSRPTCLALPTLVAMICEEFGLTRLFLRSQRLAQYRIGDWVVVGDEQTNQPSISCLLVRRAALEHVGLLDERFLTTFEDIDLCWRLRQAGWQTLFVTDAVVTQNRRRGGEAERAEILGHWYRGLFEFYRIHYPRWQLPILRLVVQISTLFRVMTGKREYRSIAKYVWKL